MLDKLKKGVLKKENPRQLAVEYYAPLFLLISMSDKTGNNEEYIDIISNHTEHFMQSYMMNPGGENE